MMLLPSGRSNGDVPSLSNRDKQSFPTNKASPQQSLNANTTRNVKAENGGYTLSSATSSLSALPPTLVNKSIATTVAVVSNTQSTTTHTSKYQTALTFASNSLRNALIIKPTITATTVSAVITTTATTINTGTAANATATALLPASASAKCLTSNVTAAVSSSEGGTVRLGEYLENNNNANIYLTNGNIVANNTNKSAISAATSPPSSSSSSSLLLTSTSLTKTSTTTTTTTAAAAVTTTTVTTVINSNATLATFATKNGNWEEINWHLQAIQTQLKDGWNVHVGKEGRLYYCNHLTHTAGWLPSCEDWSRHEELPYGWERAIDSKGRSYYINHVNKTSTYEVPESIRWEEENLPEPRVVVLQRSPTLGFGFVAGSERPVIVRFVTEDGPSINKLLPGDQILSINGEDVKNAPRDRVIQLVRACDTRVTLLVCQPMQRTTPGRKSTLLSATKKAKLKSRPSRVRFAESVCVNGAPLFPPSAFSLGDICVPPMANVLKVFLENGQTKSFKYDSTTTVQDVVTSLMDKLCFTSGEIFSLVLEHVKSLKRNKLTLLDPEESLARIASRPGAHKLRCLFRVTFIPLSAAELAQKDLNALDYLYMQCCNDVTQERFAPELQPELALRLAALHIHQHALANNVTASKLTVKVVEREFGLERFVPTSLFEGMKRKELRRLISHFLKLNAEMTGTSNKVLTQLQAKLHYLDIIGQLPSYGAKCFSTNQRDGLERVLLVSPRFGLSQISNIRNSVPQPVSAIEDFIQILLNREDDITCSVSIFMQGERMIKYFMEDRDAYEFALCLAGYFRVLTGNELPVAKEREPLMDEDNPPSYLAQHTVLPALWSYLKPYHNRPHSINFLVPPPYHPIHNHEVKYSPPPLLGVNHSSEMTSSNLCDNNMDNSNLTNSNHLGTVKMPFMDLDIHSVMATELLEEAKDSGLSDSSGGGSTYGERSQTSSSCSAKIEAKNEEVLRRVREMQKMVENSEQYLNEHGELGVIEEQNKPTQFCLANVTKKDNDNKTNVNGTYWKNPITTNTTGSTNCYTTVGGVIELDSDCDSLSSSKLSSNEDSTQASALKHSDSLVLLAETINQDLSGITKGLNSIEGNNPIGQTTVQRRKPSLNATSSPRPERKVNGFSQLLSNLQALSTDLSQSESDSESLTSPTNSPTIRRPSLLNTTEKSSRKQNLINRSSFGLHSPDSNTYGMETKDYNLKEYLKQLKEISNMDNFNQDTDTTAKKLSEIYGFEIHENTFIETDSDVIDLRAIPPPQTPDELGALSLLNAAPHGFDDANTKRSSISVAEGDLDKFLEKVVVAPPTQKATPAKELTPEEIISYIIPPPPNLDDLIGNSNNYNTVITKKRTNNYSNKSADERKLDESLYSNTITAQINKDKYNQQQPEKQRNTEKGHIIEYATVERRSKFSCCPKACQEESNEDLTEMLSDLKLPPRSYSADQTIPARPPKTADLVQRYSPKKQLNNNLVRPEIKEGASNNIRPTLPPRTVYNTSPSDARNIRGSPTTSEYASTGPLVPKKPPLPPMTSRPLLRKSRPLPVNGSNARDVKIPTIPQSPPPPAVQPRVVPPISPLLQSIPQSPTLSAPQTPIQQDLQQQQLQQQQPFQSQLQLHQQRSQQQENYYYSSSNSDYREELKASHSSPYPLLYSPQMSRKCQSSNTMTPRWSNHQNTSGLITSGSKLIIKNGHVIDAEVLLDKTDVAMTGLLVKLDQVAGQCTAAQAAGGGINIDEEKFQKARNELTEQTLALVNGSKLLVVAMSDMTLSTLPEHLTSCLTAIRRITELTQDMTRHTSAPLQTRNIVLKVHDVASSFRDLVGVQIGPLGAGQLALQAECLANVLATLLRSLRVFSP